MSMWQISKAYRDLKKQCWCIFLCKMTSSRSLRPHLILSPSVMWKKFKTTYYWYRWESKLLRCPISKLIAKIMPSPFPRMQERPLRTKNSEKNTLKLVNWKPSLGMKSLDNFDPMYPATRAFRLSLLAFYDCFKKQLMSTNSKKWKITCFKRWKSKRTQNARQMLSKGKNLKPDRGRDKKISMNSSFSTTKHYFPVLKRNSKIFQYSMSSLLPFVLCIAEINHGIYIYRTF